MFSRSEAKVKKRAEKAEGSRGVDTCSVATGITRTKKGTGECFGASIDASLSRLFLVPCSSHFFL